MQISNLPVVNATSQRQDFRQHREISVRPRMSAEPVVSRPASGAAPGSLPLVNPDVTLPPGRRVNPTQDTQLTPETGFRARLALYTYQEIGQARLDGTELLNRLDLFA